MINYIKGYYTITVEGVEVERFINNLIRNNVKVYNVNRKSKTKVEFCIDRHNIKLLKKCYRESEFNVKVKQATGIPFILRRVYKLKSMWICAVISLGLLMMTSQFVTDIYIQVPEGIKKEELRKELDKIGLKPGIYKKNIDRKEVRDELMLKFEEIAYVSINVKGTNIFVTVTKKAETLSSSEQSDYCNIIAEKNGVIESVIPRSGKQIKNPGDVANKGDILISGANTKSLPEVWARTFYEVSKSASYENIIKEETGNKKRVYTINLYDKEYTIRRNIKYKDYIIENKEHKLSIGNYTFPIKINVSTFKETKDIPIKKDKEELKKELQDEALKELEYIIPPSAKYVNVEHDYKVNKNMLEYIVTVQTSENIAQVHTLSKSEAKQLIDNDKKNESGEPIPENKEKRPKDDIRNQFESDDDKKNEENNNQNKENSNQNGNDAQNN